MNLILKRVLKKQQIEIVRVTDNVYLGNFKSAIDKKTLIDENIKAILNVSTFDYHIDYTQLNIDYLNIAFNDSIDECLMNYIPNTVAFIKEHAEQNENVLIHCVQGISRSPSILMAYLIMYEQLNVYDAYSRVKTVRPRIRPNSSFLASLYDLHTFLTTDSRDEQYIRYNPIVRV
jgi:protein-tyrosine phosphatase